MSNIAHDRTRPSSFQNDSGPGGVGCDLSGTYSPRSPNQLYFGEDRTGRKGSDSCFTILTTARESRHHWCEEGDHYQLGLVEEIGTWPHWGLVFEQRVGVGQLRGKSGRER